MRTLVANQTLAQQQTGRTPYIKLVFYSPDSVTSYDFSTDSIAYGNRILMIDDTEKPYSRNTFIMLQNPAQDVPDLTGYWVEIGYGDTYSGTAYYELTSRVWVKHQRDFTAMGKQYMLLECEGIWEIMAEQQLLLGDPPLYENLDIDGYPLFNGTWTVYEIILSIMVHVVTRVNNYTVIQGIENITSPATDDGILNTYHPIYEIAYYQDRSVLTSIQWLIHMTKCVIRNRASNVLNIIYPQDTDATDETYYPDQYPYYYEYVDRENITTPNRVIVYGLLDPKADLGWYEPGNVISGEAQIDDTQRNKYMDVYEVVYRSNISNVTDLNQQAQVILDQNINLGITGSLVIPHDARVELYDFVGVVNRY